jgi:hypothetical protein
VKLLPAFTLLGFLFFAEALGAANLCPPMPKAEKEGDSWYIPEEAFTKKEANKGLKELQSLIENGWKGQDFDVHNPTIRIKGYLFRSYLTEYKKEFGEEDKVVKKEFGRFIREEAFVSH